MGPLDFFIDLILLAAIWHWGGSTQPLTEMSTGHISLWVKKGRPVGQTTLPRGCAECLEILGASTARSPKDLPRSQQPQLYLFFHFYYVMELNYIKLRKTLLES
jgi:hypothetical protein